MEKKKSYGVLIAGAILLILGIILGFGIPEAIVAGILTTAITKVLFKIMKDNG